MSELRRNVVKSESRYEDIKSRDLTQEPDHQKDILFIYTGKAGLIFYHHNEPRRERKKESLIGILKDR